VRVSRRCEFGLGERWFTATIGDVSVNGAALQVYNDGFRDFAIHKEGRIRFQPYGDMPVSELPVEIRNFETVGDVTTMGCRYMPQKGTDHRLIADLIFANSSQWTQFQMDRRRNPGLLRGTIWFLGVAMYQTTRGLSYLMKDMGRKRPAGET
jgi:cellulose synthase (UDP-forming)